MWGEFEEGPNSVWLLRIRKAKGAIEAGYTTCIDGTREKLYFELETCAVFHSKNYFV